MCKDKGDPSTIFTYDPCMINLRQDIDFAHDLNSYSKRYIGIIIYRGGKDNERMGDKYDISLSLTNFIG